MCHLLLYASKRFFPQKLLHHYNVYNHVKVKDRIIVSENNCNLTCMNMEPWSWPLSFHLHSYRHSKPRNRPSFRQILMHLDIASADVLGTPQETYFKSQVWLYYLLYFPYFLGNLHFTGYDDVTSIRIDEQYSCPFLSLNASRSITMNLLHCTLPGSYYGYMFQRLFVRNMILFFNFWAESGTLPLHCIPF